MATGNYVEALNNAQEASEKYPTHTGFIQLIGENQLRLGNTEDAKRSFQRAIKLNPKDINPDKDLKEFPIYKRVSGDQVEGYSIPISGKGLWGTMYGYFSIEPDGATAKGITFYSHIETPGLGAEVDKPWFQNNFPGKKFVDPNGKLIGIQAIKGGVDNTSPEAYHQVDGISGATMTTNGLNSFLYEGLKNYDPYLSKVRSSSSL